MRTSARRSATVIALAVIVALAVWALTRLVGAEPTVGKGADASAVSAIEVAAAALVSGLAAWGLYTLLARRGWAGWWPFIGSTLLAVSMNGPSYFSDGASAIALMCMHFAVAIVLIPGLMGWTPRWVATRAPEALHN